MASREREGVDGNSEIPGGLKSPETPRGASALGALEAGSRTLTAAQSPDQQKVQQLLAQAGEAHRAGRMVRLKTLLEQVLAIEPENPQALYNLAVIFRDNKEIGKAETYFRKAVKADPENIDCYQGLGDLFYNAGHMFSAVKVYEQGLKRAPNRLSILSNLLRSRIVMRQPKDVEALARRVIAINDQETDVWCYLAWALLDLGKPLDEALVAIDKALAINGGNMRAAGVKYLILEKMGDKAATKAMLDEIMAEARTCGSLSIKALTEILLWTHAVPLAVRVLEAYLEHHPEDPEAESALLQAAMFEGDFEAGRQMIDRIAKTVANSPNLKMIQCLNGFRMADYAGAKKVWDSRWLRPNAEPKWDLPCPEWTGAPILDGKLAIYAEQGVGDHVMYAGQMVPVRDRARQIVFETGPRLISLFQRSFPDFEVVHRSQLPPGWRNEDVKAKVAAADVVQVMGMDFENLPARDGVLIPDPTKLAELRKAYQAKFPGKLLVGISWRSGNRDGAAIRSLELSNWKPIFEQRGVAFISLQYGDVSRDLEELKTEHGVDVHWDKSVDPMGNMDPFTAQVAAMDLVISVDNSTVHFAAALGKPVWAMLPINSDWRWLTKRTKSLWYDSLELFRQYKGDTWEKMVATVAQRLGAFDAATATTAHVAMCLRSANTLYKYGRIGEAEDYFRMLLEMGACKDQALHGIGMAAIAAGQAAEALPILARAVELSPERDDFRADLAIALDAAGDSPRAERLARDTIRRNETSIEALLAMGNILSRQGRHDEATDYFARVLRKSPEHVASRLKLAQLQAAQGEWDLAQANYRKTLEFAPSAAAAHAGVAEAALRLGDYAQGWKHFAWRFGTRPGALPRHLESINPDKRPKSWDGGHLKRSRVFLRAERSLGEQLLFAPLLDEVEAEARSVFAECDPRLLPLLSVNYPKVSFTAAGTFTPEALERNRIQIATSLGDLAARFRGDAKSFPAAPGILEADPELVATFRAEYGDCFPGRSLVGLSWRGGETAPKTTLSDWLALWDVADLGIVAVQRGASDDELADFAAAGRDMVVDPRAKSDDLGPYAAQLSALDLVIALDDVTAHLAARLGKPVLKVVGPIDTWCWGAAGDLTAWYPRMKIVRMASGDTKEKLISAAIEMLDRMRRDPIAAPVALPKRTDRAKLGTRIARAR